MRLRIAILALAAAACAAGSAARAQQVAPDPISILDQTDGINHSRMTTVALYCRADPCTGTATVGLKNSRFGRAPFSIPAKTTAKVPIRLSKTSFALIKAAPGRKLKVALTATMADGRAFTHTITLKA